MIEVNKRIDPDLPFYYWTGVNKWYHLKALPSFNQPSKCWVECLDRTQHNWHMYTPAKNQGEGGTKQIWHDVTIKVKQNENDHLRYGTTSDLLYKQTQPQQHFDMGHKTSSQTRLNSHSAMLTVKVIHVQQGTFAWTIPCLPVLAIEWRKAKIRIVSYKRLYSALQIIEFFKTMFSWCFREIENEKYTVTWEFVLTTMILLNLHSQNCDNILYSEDIVMEQISQDTSDDEGYSEDVLVLHTTI